METIIKQVEELNDAKEAIEWLKKEYPKGLDLVYIDYRDQFEDTAQLQKVLKDGYSDIYDNGDDGSYETILEVEKNYMQEMKADEISDEVRDAMQEWLQDHDTSNPIKELIENTNKQLFYIETEDYAEQGDNTGCNEEDYKRILKKYGKTEAEKIEIKHTLDNQFYGAPVSFYFYADPINVFNVIHYSDKKYIQVCGAYFSTINRCQGSNWLCDNAIFNIIIEREKFIKDVYLDKAKGNGYGWDQIAGQCDYDSATIRGIGTKKHGNIIIASKTSPAQKREKELSENYEKTGKCSFGDMNYARHKNTEYINNYPCGNKCKDCGTFWID